MSIVNIIQRKQKWAILEILDEITHTLVHEYYVDMSYNLSRIRFYILFIIENILLLVVILAYYYLMAFMLQIQTKLLYISYYIVNMTSMIFATEYVCFVYTIKQRIWMLNCVMKQLLLDSNTGYKSDELEIRTPKIAYNEIFSIHGQTLDEKKQIRIEQNHLKNTENNASIIRQLRLIFRPTTEDSMNLVKQPKIGHHSLSSDITLFIEKMSSLHCMACECVVLTNRTYSFQLMLHFAAMFLFFVFGLFALYKAFNITSIRFQLIAAANGFWIVYYLITILVIIHSTSSTVDVMHASGDIVHEIIRSKQKSFSNAIIEKLSTLGLQIKMRDVSFSCGLFHFDWPLFASILAAIAMYLVFLIQFDVTPTQMSMNSTVKQ